MFEKIPFTNIVAKNRLLSENSTTKKDYENPVYNKENLMNSKFVISGSARFFSTCRRWPVSLCQNLFHVESFMIFHYGFDSFTERQNFQVLFLIMYSYFRSGNPYLSREKLYSERRRWCIYQLHGLSSL